MPVPVVTMAPVVMMAGAIVAVVLGAMPVPEPVPAMCLRRGRERHTEAEHDYSRE